jgi:hypothetical protein
MSTAILESLCRFVQSEPEDDFMAQRQKQTARIIVDMWPDVKAEVVRDAQIARARVLLRRVLAHRKLPLTAAEEARIDTCTDPATLEQWFDQALDADSAAEVLR